MNNFIEASKTLHKENSSYGKASEYSRKGTMKYEMRLPEAIAAAHKFNPFTTFLIIAAAREG